MNKFQNAIRLFNSLKQNGWEELSIDTALMTKKSQDLVNEWCQDVFNKILIQFTDIRYSAPCHKYRPNSSKEVNKWILEQVTKIRNEWYDWYQNFTSCPTSFYKNGTAKPFDSILKPEDYFQLNGIYAHVSDHNGAHIRYVGKTLLELYDFLQDDESYEELLHFYFGKSELTFEEEVYLLSFSI